MHRTFPPLCCRCQYCTCRTTSAQARSLASPGISHDVSYNTGLTGFLRELPTGLCLCSMCVYKEGRKTTHHTQIRVVRSGLSDLGAWLARAEPRLHDTVHRSQY